ncbi:MULTISPECIES: hypothetical protein [Enterobacteriaceae]|uniref:hypothetical protein n=1 Tax=Enterobacteriaceae TaxID=543 RepID=UPI000FEB74BD|nr:MULTISPECIES: hypothetical protein [Enterobacteriaceae]MBS6131536.1 hypothetical protein [Enterobacter cloacae]RWT89244.1 hypothetical protein DN590_22925 [Citrobacter freundii]HAS1952958.1 hypothetical protein [Enterobacter asburiae]MDV0514421.1 hypothetical protein [Citrobacter portucalensis]MDV0519655.1 hypothetical protein [Citrobacter portucalensis]
MQLILKSAKGVHIDIQGDSASDLLKVSQLCALLDISYTGVRQRIFRGDTIEQAIHYFLDKQGGGDA